LLQLSARRDPARLEKDLEEKNQKPDTETNEYRADESPPAESGAPTGEVAPIAE
jgi:hypothetical protein